NMQSFSTSVSHNFHCKANINAYLTPTGMKGFPPHFDNTDVFILQTLGVKHWNIFEDYSNSMELPLRDTPWNPDKYHPGVNKQLVELHPGDILYIPRGGMHSAACRAGLSLHLTISLD